MARRHQNSGRAGATDMDPAALRRDVERLIEKRDFKDAFKQAKLCFRQEPSTENRQLVERTYLLRIQALARGGMTGTAREVAGNLLEFGVTKPQYLQELLLLLPQLGLTDKALALRGQFASSEVQASLTTKLADRAVLHPDEAAASIPEIREAAGQVRLALTALDADDDARALELLQSVPRGSPLSDWRYFVRGLAAFRRSEREQAAANWERLDPQRAARKIASALLATATSESSDGLRDPPVALETCVFGEPVLERLHHLRRAMEAADWKRVLQLTGTLRRSLHRIDPRWSQRLTEIVLGPLAAEATRREYSEAQRLVREIMASLEPLPWDPRWNRFQALLWDGPQGNPEETIRYWRRYVQDLERCPPLPGTQPSQIQALVLRRIGEMSACLAEDDDDGLYPPDSLAAEFGEEQQSFRDQAIAALEQSLLLDPKQRKTHELLIELYDAWEKPDHMVAAIHAQLRAFPDDVAALQRLIQHHQRRDEPEPVLRTIERIRALRPLDTAIIETEIWARLAMARHLALQNRWDEGRAEFTRAQALPQECLPAYRLLSRCAMFEFKAGQTEQAEEFVRQAEAALDEPTALWLALAVEAARYRVPSPLRQRFDRLFRAAIARKATSKTAGALAEVINGYLVGAIEYTGRAEHIDLVVSYLRRTTRLKYQESDLADACLFLQTVDDESMLLEKLARRGRKLFPKSPFFLHLNGVLDLARGPFGCNPRQVQTQLEQALRLAQESKELRDVALVPLIKETLSRVQDACEALSSLPFPPDAMPSMPRIFRDMFETQDGDDSDFYDEPASDSRSRRRPGRNTR